MSKTYAGFDPVTFCTLLRPRSSRNPLKYKDCYDVTAREGVTDQKRRLGNECVSINHGMEIRSVSKGKEVRKPIGGLPGVLRGFMIPHMEGRRPPPTPEELQQRLNEHFAAPLESRDEHLRRHQPMSRPDKLTPEEIQRALDEHFGHLNPPAHWPEPRIEPAPPPKRSPQEVQQRLNELFGGDAARPVGSAPR
jgi:hypothetical protein